MRNLQDFCAVCQRRIEAILDPYLPNDLPYRLRERFDFYWERINIPRWILVAYLIANRQIKDLANDIKFNPSEEFYNTVAKYLGAYMVQNTMPPKAITGAILNLADDYLSNRPIDLRAGDYLGHPKLHKKKPVNTCLNSRGYPTEYRDLSIHCWLGTNTPM